MRFIPISRLGWGRNVKLRDFQGVLVLGDVWGDINQASVARLDLPDPGLREGQSILAWLDWRTGISPHLGRETELTDLLRWAKDSGPGVRARFLTGPGGAGKSRLGAELARKLRGEGWEAGFLNLAREPPPFYAGKVGTLVLIDYPEEHKGAVRSLLADAGNLGVGGRVRLLLLGRAGREAWQHEIAGTPGAEVLFDPTLSIPPMEEAPAYRAFTEARTKLATALGISPSKIEEHDFGAWLEIDPLHRQPLFIVAAAIHSVLYPEERTVGLRGPGIIKALAEREIARLRDESRDAGMHESVLPRLVALAAVQGHLDAKAIESLAGRRDLKLGFPPPRTRSSTGLRGPSGSLAG